MTTNHTNAKIHKPELKILYPELSYQITGICFEVQNKLGRFAREKQYCDLLEELFKYNSLSYKREFTVQGTGNRVDFLVADVIIVEVKVIPFILRGEFDQARRYLDITNLELALLVNFREKYLKPQRVLNPSTIR